MRPSNVVRARCLWEPPGAAPRQVRTIRAVTAFALRRALRTGLAVQVPEVPGDLLPRSARTAARQTI